MNFQRCNFCYCFELDHPQFKKIKNKKPKHMPYIRLGELLKMNIITGRVNFFYGREVIIITSHIHDPANNSPRIISFNKDFQSQMISKSLSEVIILKPKKKSCRQILSYYSWLLYPTITPSRLIYLTFLKKSL